MSVCLCLSSLLNAQSGTNTVQETSGYIKQSIANNTPQDLFHTMYVPANQNVKATILILHGMQEHSGRYVEFARFLSEAGFAVLTYDHLGHGKTAKDRTNLGYFQQKKPAGQLVNDTEKMADVLQNAYPAVPHFILGHSMGSFVARGVLQQAAERFDGAIIVGTGGQTKGARLGKAYFGLLNKINPHKRGRFNKSFSKMNNKPFKDERNPDGTSWLSLSETNRNAFKQDSLSGVPFTNNGFYTLLSIHVRATKRHWAKEIPCKLPFLFVSGADDPIGGCGKGVEKTVKDMEKDGFQDVTLKLYPQMRHEILNEDIRFEVYKAIVSWIDIHLQKTQTNQNSIP